MWLLLTGEDMNAIPVPHLNILVLCTGNSARSIMAEALINVLGQGYLHAFSAGSRPVGSVNPLAVKLISKLGYSPSYLRSKSWNEFTGEEAPNMDIVITVCDNAANEACPNWPGKPIKLHWGFEDPAAASGSEADKHQAFEQCFNLIRQKVEELVGLSLHERSKPECVALLMGLSTSDQPLGERSK